LNIVFPDSNGARYYHTLYPYVLNVFKAAGCKIEFSNKLWGDACQFIVEIDGKPALFDLSDFEGRVEKGVPVFKRTLLEKLDNTYPMGPILGMYKNINQTAPYMDLNELRAAPTIESTEEVLYSQRAYGDATTRRNNLAKILPNQSRNLPARQYWEWACTHKYNVFLTGANHYVLDRAPSELMYLGKTVLYPRIDIFFPEWKRVEAGKHYIEIDLEGKNVLEKLSGDTGEAAKEFMACCEPQNLVEWWASCL
jgi:hypothetical protein